MRGTEKSVVIDTTNRVNGMLEKGGVMGLVEAYPLADVERVTGLSGAQLRGCNGDELCPGYQVSIRDLIQERLSGRIVRRGQRIA